MRVKRCIFFIAVFLVASLISLPFAYSQDDELEMLDSLEKEAGATQDATELDLLDELDGGKTPESKGGLAETFLKLGRNLGGSLRVRYMHYLRGAENRDNSDLYNDHVNYTLRFDTYTSGKDWRFDLAGWAEGGNEQWVYAGTSRWFQDAHRDERRHLEISELFLTVNRPSYDLFLGKKIFNNGLSTLFSPADRLRPQESLDPMDPKDLGLWQAKIDYYKSGYTFTGALFPVFDNGKIPPASSRWRGSSKGSENRDYEFSDDVEAEEDYPEIKIDNMGYFARAKTTLKGWDLFASVYSGLNPYAVLKEEKRGAETVQVKKNVRVGNYAAGFSTTWKKWEFHGEALYNHSLEGKDDNYFSFVGGFTYTIDDYAKKVFLDRIDITIEYAAEWEIRAQYAKDYTKSSRDSRLGKNDIFTRIRFKYSEDLEFVYISDFELDNAGRYNHFDMKYDFGKGFSTKIAVEFFNGEDESYYGRWWRNDRIITELKYKF